VEEMGVCELSILRNMVTTSFLGSSPEILVKFKSVRIISWRVHLNVRRPVAAANVGTFASKTSKSLEKKAFPYPLPSELITPKLFL
jgi:hypothetical protein